MRWRLDLRLALHFPTSSMSAAQIPNLNTLRRGGGRGRSRGGRGDNASSGSSSHGGHHTYGLGKDRVVQGTDTDASVSRMSAVSLGYLNDPFAQFMTPPGVTATRRLPIINRGRLCSTGWPTKAVKTEIVSLFSRRHLRPNSCNRSAGGTIS